MKTTEKIVEAYVRHVKRWATIPNVRCDGQFEIDLLAIDPVTLERYHIETSVSGSQVYSKLTSKDFDPALLKVRVQKAKMRRTLGYFVTHKFGTPAVVHKLAEYGFNQGSYRKVVVTWDWTPDAKVAADQNGIELWDFRKLMRDIAKSIRDSRSYFTDDTLRTINLFARALVDSEADPETNTSKASKLEPAREAVPAQNASAPYWVYRNWIHGRARLHKAACGYCNNGIGAQGSSANITGEWKPFSTEADAKAFLATTKYEDAKLCGVCMEGERIRTEV
jgi:hypothetical protein